MFRRFLLALIMVFACMGSAILAVGPASAASQSTAIAHQSALAHAPGTLTRANPPAEQLTAPDAAIGGGGEYTCDAFQFIRYPFTSKVLAGGGYVLDCVGAAACSQQAFLQIEGNPNAWDTIADGATKSGCSAPNESLALAKCQILKPGDNWAYRTRVNYAIVWDNGNVTEATLYSPHYVGNILC